MSGAHGRSKTRQTAVQALYQWQVSGLSVSEIEGQFQENRDLSGVDRDYFRELLGEISQRLPELDGHLAPLLDRSIEGVDPVERAILRLGVYELCHRADVPYRVILNEAIDLAKLFGAEDGHKYVNGILDGVARTVRASELARHQAR